MVLTDNDSIPRDERITLADAEYAKELDDARKAYDAAYAGQVPTETFDEFIFRQREERARLRAASTVPAPADDIVF